MGDGGGRVQSSSSFPHAADTCNRRLCGGSRARLLVKIAAWLRHALAVSHPRETAAALPPVKAIARDLREAAHSLPRQASTQGKMARLMGVPCRLWGWPLEIFSISLHKDRTCACSYGICRTLSCSTTNRGPKRSKTTEHPTRRKASR